MVFECLVENSSAFSIVVSICSSKGLFREGCEVHCRAVVLGFSENVYVGSALVDLYLRMGCAGIALRLFSKLQERNLATWNVALRGMCETGGKIELFRMYDEMKLEGLEPNGVSYCYLIRGCGYERCLEEGMQLHCCMIKGGFVDSDIFVSNALVDFYSACGSLVETRRAFEAIPPSDVISWNSLVSVCAANGCICDGLVAFRAMRLWGKKPSGCSFLGFLKVCSAVGDLVFGKQIHCSVLKAGFDSVLVRSALIDMYGKCGETGDAVGVYDGVVERTLECCNSLMTSLLRAELFEANAAVACALIDAYSRAGEVGLSCRVFNLLPSPDVICFTSVISALARNGRGKECLEMLDLMIRDGLRPDKVTFLSALMGCSHSGLVEEGRSVFSSMETIHSLEPERRHYACMVDLLGRAGLLDEATEMVKDTPWEDDFVIWSSVLTSCRVHQDKRIGSRAAKKLIDLQPENPSSWLQASYFYSDIGDYERSKEYRGIATARKVRREIGRSMIEVQEFRSHHG